jgi:hypothetical protein
LFTENFNSKYNDFLIKNKLIKLGNSLKRKNESENVGNEKKIKKDDLNENSNN